jgi:hypothetical protein
MVTDDTPPKELPSEVVDLAVAELRYQTAFYLEAVQAMMDGVTLGAENVQDKRIELLELGPATDSKATVLTIVLTLILEGTIGPAIAAGAVRAVLRPMMRATARAIHRMPNRVDLFASRLFRVRAESKSQAALHGKGFTSPQRVAFILEARKLNNAADLLRQDMRGRVGSAKLVREGLDRIMDFVEANLVAGAKATLAVNSLPGSSTPLRGGQSPGVSVVAAAMASAARLRLTTIASHEALEAEIKHPDSTLGDVSTLLDEYRVDDECDLAQIRDSCALAAEAMIWASLVITESSRQHIALLNRPPVTVYHGPSQRATRLSTVSGDRGIPYGGLQPMVSTLDEKLLSYLMVRFGKEIERWALEKNEMLVHELKQAGNPFPVPPRPTGWWEGMDNANRTDLLMRFLSAVSDRIPAMEFSLR